jgi:phosphoserine phosphatase
MTKVSFDFDGTLTLPEIQDVANELITKGFEVWILTARCLNMDNDDLLKIANKLGIRYIRYMCFMDKYTFLKDNGFLFHIDDDIIELNMIEEFTDVVPICHLDWGR